MNLQDYIAEQVLNRPTEYTVEITETFRKTVNVKAANEAEALEFVQRKYFADEVFLTVDDDFMGTDFKVLGEVKC